MADQVHDRVAEVKSWAIARIAACRAQEQKFGTAWQHREKHQHGPPQALVEAWTERRALQAVLEMLSPGCLAPKDHVGSCYPDEERLSQLAEVERDAR